VIEQLLPICNLTMFEQQLECDVFKEQVFGRTKNSREALLLFFCHGSKNSLTQWHLPIGRRTVVKLRVLTSRKANRPRKLMTSPGYVNHRPPLSDKAGPLLVQLRVLCLGLLQHRGLGVRK